MSTEIAFVLLFAIATAVAIAARTFKVPYTVALVVAGLGLGVVPVLEVPHLTKELLYALFLPGLLFEAAFHLEFQKFWKNKISVFSLAIPGLLAAIALTAAILTPVADALGLEEGFTFVHGLVFAALIAATDPIAVVGLFKSLGAPKRLAILVEGESLINDGTAVVVFTLMFGLATGKNLTVANGVAQFFVVAGAGGLVGLLFGFGVSWLTHQIEDPMVEITLTTVAAYGSFAVAEHFHVSGVIATVVAGMLCGNYGARTGMGPSTKVAVLSFWEYWAFALNSVVFLLIGFEVKPELLVRKWKPILVAWVAVTAARAAVVYLSSTLLRLTKERFPWSWTAILTWGGLRGSLSMVLVLALPRDFPHREFLIHITFGVVVISILLQGMTIGPLLRWLDIVRPELHLEEYESKRAAIRAAKAAIDEITRMEDAKRVEGTVLDTLRGRYQSRIRTVEAELQALSVEKGELRQRELIAAARHLLLIEKETLLESFHEGYLSKERFETMVGEVDAQILALDEEGKLTQDAVPQVPEGG